MSHHNPSLTLHLHPHHFTLNNGHAQYRYTGVLQPLIEAVQMGTLTTEMGNILQAGNVKWNNGKNRYIGKENEDG